jgi:PAS domain S-box-containing protein
VSADGVSVDALVQSSLVGEALEDGPALVFVADHEMHYVAVNRFACDALGYTRAELLELRVTDVAVETAAPTLYDDMLRRRAGSGSTPLRRRDGTLVTFTYRASQTTLAGLTLYVSVGFLDDVPRS